MQTYQKILTVDSKDSSFKTVKITSAAEAADYCRQFFHADISLYESFFLLMLNRQLQTIGWAKISQGGVAGTVADVRIIAKYVVDCLASSVILCHNHPSGNSEPSPQDLKLTEKIQACLANFDCTVQDHIILTSERFFAFSQDGLL
jgi:DNA repair protein RadC